MQQCMEKFGANDPSFSKEFRIARRIMETTDGAGDRPWNSQHCYTGCRIGIKIRQAALLVARDDFVNFWKYQPEDVEGVKVVKVLGVEGDAKMTVGVLLQESQAGSLPSSLPAMRCEVFSVQENVLVEDSMTRASQLRKGQGTHCFLETNRQTIAARGTAMQNPELKRLPTIDDLAALMAAHKTKLENQARIDEARARGNFEPADREDDSDEDQPTAFQAPGLAMLSTAATDKAGSGAHKLTTPRKPTPKVQQRRREPSAALTAPPSVTSSIRGQSPSRASASKAPAWSSSARVDLAAEQPAESWKKVNPQDILDGKEILGKKLNGAGPSGLSSHMRFIDFSEFQTDP